MRAVELCWNAAGRPEPNWTGKAKTARSAPPVRQGVCALLGRRCDVVDIRHVLSDLFTAWDRLPHRTHPEAGLSIPAAWAFRSRPAMQRPHAIIDGTFREVTSTELCDLLLADDPRMVVTVPQSRQKHLLPFAVTGHVQVDDEALRWDEWDRRRLEIYRELRNLGFGETALLEPAPRWAILTKLTDQARGVAVSRWHELDPWRSHPAYMDIAARATRPVKKED